MRIRTKQIALWLYVLCSILAVIATIVDDDLMILLVKPAVIPSLLYYYLSAKTGKTNGWFVAVLLLNFIGDTIVLLEIKDQTLVIMIPYFISYLIMLFFAVADLRRMKIIASGIFIVTLIFAFLVYILNELIQMFADSNPELVVPVIVYGITLALLGVVGAYNYYCRVTGYTFYLVMYLITSIVSDVFYMLFHFLFEIQFLNYFEFALQLVSYYFVVKYFVSRKIIPV